MDDFKRLVVGVALITLIFILAGWVRSDPTFYMSASSINALP